MLSLLHILETMEFEQILNYLAYLIPAVLVGIIAFYFFKGYMADEQKRRNFELVKKTHDATLPMRLQAYERMSLFLERIDPNKLLTRVKPFSDDIGKYEELLVKNIDQEYEHNISQQIYISPECWNLIKTAKNATLQMIRQTAMSDKIDNADKLRESLLNHFMGEITPSQKALMYVKKEVTELFG